MTNHDTGVDRIFHEATHRLNPDVDRLVAGGLERGRVRRRRHLAGTAVAAVATVGVIGVGAAVVPQLTTGPAGDLPVASGETSSTVAASPSVPPSATPTPPPASESPAPDTTHLGETAGPTVHAADIPGLVDQLVPGHDVGEPLMQPPYGVSDAPDDKTVHFEVDGMLTTVIIGPASPTLAYDCADEAVVDCRTLPDGTVVQVSVPTVNDGVTMQEVIALGDAWMVSVLSYNADDRPKSSEPLQDAPALDEEELVTLATSDAWFE
ncbi:MAG TPA: hypothetical protein VFM50_02540 [Nocardioidaceae bacterium]|nr:hypothetical protein [Nocardioidaceae bacterium]